jgi:hypothetical protein
MTRDDNRDNAFGVPGCHISSVPLCVVATFRYTHSVPQGPVVRVGSI